MSQGNPRLINQVADIALTYGYAEQARTITAQLVAQAALDRIKGRILPLAATEELVVLASSPEEISAQQGSSRTRSSDLAIDEPSEAPSIRSPEEDYERGWS